MQTIVRSIFIAGLLFSVSCHSDSVPQTYRYGPTTQTGTVRAAPVSLTRRGSHLLTISGKDSYYLESKTDNLSEYEGQLIQVDGTLEPNTNPEDIPVIVVSRLTPVLGSNRPHEWRIPALGIQLTAPESWDATILDTVIAGTIVTFKTGSLPQPILTISLQKAAPFPAGTPIHVRGRAGVRVSGAGFGAEDLFIMNDATTLKLEFQPQVASEAAPELAVYRHELTTLLSSLRFLSDETSSSQLSTGSGSGDLCGGEAGILCPGGMYCEVFDARLRIGRCRPR